MRGGRTSTSKAEEMRAANARLRRGRGAAPRQRPEPSQAEPIGTPAGALLRIEEEVVHDLSHELGNYFHKLYYWTDCIRSGATDLGPETSATDALDQTLHRLQAFLNLALEYFQPSIANPIAVSGNDVVKAFEALLRGENPEAAIASECTAAAGDASVRIDTGRLSTAFRTMARLLGGGPGTSLHLAADVARDGGAPERLEIALSASGGSPDAAARRAQRVVEWAVAARLVELHGGRLQTNEERPGSARCVLTLPLVS